tara:strand:- start:840 stop:1367 length:528 start_codon:yes stop_codon:yes gene_type:complete
VVRGLWTEVYTGYGVTAIIFIFFKKYSTSHSLYKGLTKPPDRIHIVHQFVNHILGVKGIVPQDSTDGIFVVYQLLASDLVIGVIRIRFLEGWREGIEGVVVEGSFIVVPLFHWRLLAVFIEVKQVSSHIPCVYSTKRGPPFLGEEGTERKSFLMLFPELFKRLGEVGPFPGGRVL